jgi:hypothetical protein
MNQALTVILLAGSVTGCLSDGADAPADPTTIAKATIFDRLGDEAGPIAGLPGFSIERRDAPGHCGGIAVRVVRAPDAMVAPADELFVRMLEIRTPSGLDFRPILKEKSLNEVKHWFDILIETAQEATRGYTTELRGATGTAVPAAIARSVQVNRLMASVLVRFEIPANLREGDDAADTEAAFCDALAKAAEPLLAKADEAARVCVEKSANLAPGWWSTVCR